MCSANGCVMYSGNMYNIQTSGINRPMKSQRNDNKNSFKLVDKRYSDYKLGWLLILIKAFFIVIAFLINIIIRKIVCPFIPFLQVKRYTESVVNLISMRLILLVLGFLQFQCDDFAYFSREGHKIYLKSGYIGIGSHKSILDFLYYSYLYNPVFVKLIIYKKGKDGQQTFYAPLSFMEALNCAFDYRGFDPIIVHNEQQYKSIKYRKLSMKTLISECFEQLNGPVFILLPGLHPNVHIALNDKIAYDIYENETKFQRSLVYFSVKLDQQILGSDYMCKNQMFVLLQLMSRVRRLKMMITAIQFRKWKYSYDKITYSTFIDKCVAECNYKVKQIDYESYLNQLNQQQTNNNDTPNSFTHQKHT